MRALLSSIGTRGDVEPLLALAIELQALGHAPRLCVAPNFKPWIESFGIECVPIGPDLREWTARPPAQPLTPEQLRRMASDMAVRPQFPVVLDAARDCDVILGAGTLQFAAPSVAEKLGVPHVFAAYCPAVLPSATHPPVKINERFAPDLPAPENLALWAKERSNWDDLFLAALNEERAKLGLAAVAHVHPYVLTERPWLAADASLGPAADDTAVFQTGAWSLHDAAPLPAAVEEFLGAGPSAVYFGFGSMRAAGGAADIVMETARALGVRAIVSRGWGNLSPASAPDVLVIDDVPHRALFPRVAAVVHHGGAGTTAAAARAGKPQVLVPHNYDQFYWAHRVSMLRIGVAAPERKALTADALASALRTALEPAMSGRAADSARGMRTDGARIAALRLVEIAAQ